MSYHAIPCPAIAYWVKSETYGHFEVEQGYGSSFNSFLGVFVMKHSPRVLCMVNAGNVNKNNTYIKKGCFDRLASVVLGVWPFITPCAVCATAMKSKYALRLRHTTKI